MRKLWLVPCSVIKWWTDGVRGREMISTGLCAPGQRNIVRILSVSKLENKDDRKTAPLPQGITTASLENRDVNKSKKGNYITLKNPHVTDITHQNKFNKSIEET